MTKKEAFLSVMRNEKPTAFMGHAFDANPQAVDFGPPITQLFYAIIDPITTWDILQFSGERYKDNWGVTHRYILGVDPGIIPLTDEENQVIKDITKWRDYVTFPEIPKDLDWEPAKKAVAKAKAAGEFVMIPSFRGLFERLHSLETFENTVVDMISEPEACNEFFEAYTDWKLEVFKQIIDNLQPDAIHSHDDLGSKNSPFFSADTFREILKPHYKRLYDYCHSRGVLVQHHCDCFVEHIVVDFAEIGVDMWQGALPSNDIVKLQKQLDERGFNMLMMGGIESAIVDDVNAKEEDIRAEVRRAIDTYAPGGHFLPCIGSINCLVDKNDPIVVDEMNRYGAEWLAKHR
ncbi:MAG: uroporphyrinogen decarboxylase (URO-D) [Oscillospiraceae bacterium]|jgi:hypothetical protein|nr:uroporphyrinogen decarboxylase (URO-D) [Oscillospiraceae bacterium]